MGQVGPLGDSIIYYLKPLVGTASPSLMGPAELLSDVQGTHLLLSTSLTPWQARALLSCLIPSHTYRARFKVCDGISPVPLANHSHNTSCPRAHNVDILTCYLTLRGGRRQSSQAERLTSCYPTKYLFYQLLGPRTLHPVELNYQDWSCSQIEQWFSPIFKSQQCGTKLLSGITRRGYF